MPTDPLKITGEDLAIIQETLRTGDLNTFTSRYMWLPHSGTMWLPGDDVVGHYRSIFRYDLLYDVWNKIGRPDDKLTVTTAAYQYHLRVVWNGLEPTFLLPHGYMILDWVKPVIDPETNLAFVITATGTGKTSAIAVAALTYCVLYPGFHFMNLANAFYSDSQFIGYGFGTSVLGAELRVLQVYPDSPASEAGLARGDSILEVDGRSVASLIASGQIGGAFGPSEAGYSSEVVFRSLAGVERRERMTKRAVTIPTVSLTRAYDMGGRRVGYLFFRNFVRPSVAALDEAFAALREAGVTDLVLDLRYKGGGLVDVAVRLSSLIGGSTTAGQPFATFAHNARNAFRNETLRFAEAPPAALTLSRLIVITSRSSASASELVINGLRPY